MVGALLSFDQIPHGYGESGLRPIITLLHLLRINIKMAIYSLFSEMLPILNIQAIAALI